MTAQLLTEVPHSEALNLRVRSKSTGVRGVVTDVTRDQRYLGTDPKGAVTTISWENGRQSIQQHDFLDGVEVLEPQCD